MEFEWDEAKRQTNLQKHGIDFEDVVAIWQGRVLSAPDRRFDYGEDRYISVGRAGREVVVVVWTVRQTRIRLISARRANSHERARYDQTESR